MSTAEQTGVWPPLTIDPEWESIGKDRHVYRCLAVFHQEESGYSVFCPQLPGAHSQGETIEEAVANIMEAVGGLIESYIEHQEEIPWNNEFSVPPDAAEKRWITVDV